MPSGEFVPDFFDAADFAGEVAGYDPNAIAEYGFWPLADQMWGADFRAEAPANLSPTSRPGEGVYDGRWYEAKFNASKDVDIFDDFILVGDEYQPKKTLSKIDSLEIFVEQLCPEALDSMINEALEHDCQSLMSALEGVEDRAELELQAMVCRRFFFSSEGAYACSGYNVIKIASGDVYYNSEDYLDDDDDEEDDKPHEDDVELHATNQELLDQELDWLLAGASVLRVPPEALAYLEQLRRGAELSQ